MEQEFHHTETILVYALPSVALYHIVSGLDYFHFQRLMERDEAADDCYHQSRDEYVAEQSLQAEKQALCLQHGVQIVCSYPAGFAILVSLCQGVAESLRVTLSGDCIYQGQAFGKYIHVSHLQMVEHVVKKEAAITGANTDRKEIRKKALDSIRRGSRSSTT